MKLTSAMAAKELKKLNEKHEALIRMEKKACEFVAAIQEDIETVRPDYSYIDVQADLNLIEKKVRELKHAINIFNLTTVVPDFNMTIDQMLVYIPQLSARKRKLESMMNRLPKERVKGYGSSSNIIEYMYANYDVKDTETDCAVVSDELAQAQNALDLVNSTVEFEYDGEL